MQETFNSNSSESFKEKNLVLKEKLVKAKEELEKAKELKNLEAQIAQLKAETAQLQGSEVTIETKEKANQFNKILEKYKGLSDNAKALILTLLGSASIGMVALPPMIIHENHQAGFEKEAKLIFKETNNMIKFDGPVYDRSGTRISQIHDRTQTGEGLLLVAKKEREDAQKLIEMAENGELLAANSLPISVEMLVTGISTDPNHIQTQFVNGTDEYR